MTGREAMSLALDALINGKQVRSGEGGTKYQPDLEDAAIASLEAALAQPEQIITPISPDQYERLCGTCGACTGKPWVGLTEGELIDIKDCDRGFWTNAAKIEQLLKDKNT